VDFHAAIKPQPAEPRQVAKTRQAWITAQKHWTSALFPLDFAKRNKSETMNSILTFFLGLLALLGVIFALQTIFLTRELRQLNAQAAADNNNLMQIQGPAQALINDVIAFNKSNPSPELTKLLQPAKPASK
jgi:hypothetical protein